MNFIGFGVGGCSEDDAKAAKHLRVAFAEAEQEKNLEASVIGGQNATFPSQKEKLAALECPAALKQQIALLARISANKKNATKKENTTHH